VRNWDMCLWESHVEAWQGHYFACVIPPLTATRADAAVVSWTCDAGMQYGERAQSRGKHWLIKYFFDWTFLGETSKEVTLVQSPQCDSARRGASPSSCGGDECDADGSRQDACIRDGGEWDASQCLCVYSDQGECDIYDEQRCHDLCGSWDAQHCECSGGAGESDRELCEYDGCVWRADCWCDCGTRPSPAQAFARALRGTR
ncbi:MAG TPA: hypothetical protein VF310_13765, partial [Vicinamibacteria bacterium]